LSKYATGTGVPTLNRNFVHDEDVLSTNNQQEQKRVVKLLDELELMTREAEEIYVEKLKNLEDLKKSILQKAFSGELTSPERTKYAKDGRSPSIKTLTNKNPERVV
jgi:type I restriction enzyme S subunit